MKINIVKFVNSYLLTASWITCDSDENTNFLRESKKTAKEDCLKFIEAVEKKLGKKEAERILTIAGNDLDYLAPHDFFLTRNHHGAGFWDKHEIYGEENAKKLTEICHKFGGVDCYHIRGKKSKLIFD